MEGSCSKKCWNMVKLLVQEVFDEFTFERTVERTGTKESFKLYS